MLTLEAPGPFAAGAEVEVTFDAIVGELPRDGVGAVLDDLVNLACVDAYQTAREMR